MSSSIETFITTELPEYLGLEEVSKDAISTLENEELTDRKTFLELGKEDLLEMKIPQGDVEIISQIISKIYADLPKLNVEDLSKFLASCTSLKKSVIQKLKSHEINGETFLHLDKDALQPLNIIEKFKKELLDLIKRILSHQTSSEMDGSVATHGNQVSLSESRPSSDVCTSDDTEEVIINIKAIIPWDGNVNDLCVHLCFYVEKMGHWGKKYRLNISICDEHRHYYFLTSEYIPFEKRVLKSSLWYKYIFTMDGNNLGERVNGLDSTDICNIHRLLDVPSCEYGAGGMLVHYDTIIYPDNPESRQKMLAEDSSIPITDAFRLRKTSLNLHLHEIQNHLIKGTVFSFGENSAIHEMCLDIEQIFNRVMSFSLQVLYRNKSPKTYPTKLNSNVMREMLHRWVGETLKFVKEKVYLQQDDASKYFVLSGAVITYLAEKFNLFQSNSQIGLSCEECCCIASLLQLQPSVDSHGQRICKEYQVLNDCILHAEFRKQLKDGIKHACVQIIHESRGETFSWLRAIPLFHFLAQLSEPFKPLPSNVKKITWTFWKEIQSRRALMMKYFQNNDGAFDKIWKENVDQKELDPVMTKVLVFICPPSEQPFILKEIPPIISLSFISWNFSNEKPMESQEVKLLEQCLEEVRKAISCNNCKQNFFNETVQMIENIICRIQSTKPCHIKAFMVFFKHLLFIFASVHDDISKASTTVIDVFWSWITHVNVIGGCTFGGTTGNKFKEELQIWRHITEIKFPETLEHTCKIPIFKLLEQRTKEVSETRKIEFFLELDKACPEEIFDVLLKMGMDGLQSSSAETVMKQTSDHSNNFGKLLSSFLIRYTGGTSKVCKVVSLQQLLTWSLWPAYFTFYKEDSSVYNAMEPIAKQIVQNAEQKIQSLLSEIENGDISRSDLEYVKENISSASCLAAKVKESIKLEIYCQRLEGLEEFEDSVSTLCNEIPRQIQCNLHDIDLSKESTKMKKMNELYDDWKDGGKICTRFYQLPNCSPLHHILKKFKVLGGNPHSTVFRNHWHSLINVIQKNDRCMSHENIEEDLWEPIITFCSELLITCANGKAIVSDLIRVFHQLDSAAIKQNLLLLQNCLQCDSMLHPKKGDEWVDDVCLKIEHFKDALNSTKIAEELLRLKGLLKRSGNHELLKNTVEHELNGYQLLNIDVEFMTYGQKLAHISTEKHYTSLKAVNESWNVVQWILETFLDNDQLKAFIDVSLFNVAEEEFNTQKLIALRVVGNSVTDFVSELKKNEESDNCASDTQQGIEEQQSIHEDNLESEELIRLCEQFWMLADRHTNLPDLLKLCNECLPWFKNIKEGEEDLHQNTMKELFSLNEKGVFVLGTDPEKVERATCLSNFIYLQSCEKKYNLEELRDLESRLALLGGQSSENTNEVHKFLNIFHSSQSVAESLFQLHQKGCIRFSWVYHFHCGENPKHLKGKEIELSQELIKWEEAINAARCHCYELNSFTVAQISQLQKELVPKYSHNGDIEDIDNSFILTYLKYLFPCVSIIKLMETIKSIWKGLEVHSIEPKLSATVVKPKNSQKVACVEQESQELSFDEVIANVLNDNQKRTYMKLMCAGLEKYSYFVLAEILENGSNEDSDSVVTHTIYMKTVNEELGDKKFQLRRINDHLERVTNFILKEVDETIEHCDDTIDGITMKNPIVHEIPLDSAVSDILQMRVHSSLSIDQLCFILSQLSKKLETEKSIQYRREIPGMNVVHGSPNLFVTTEELVLPTVLSFYACDSEKPLPTQEEVLICKEDTTPEEVILFWRRCIFDPQHKRIFCLVHGEKLPYSACEVALKELAKLKQGVSEYRLIIVCSERKRRSHLVTSLHSYSRCIPDVSLKNIGDYLHSHLIEPTNGNLGTSPSDGELLAYSVDSGRSYARIIYSDISGMGKTLYIKRKGEDMQRLIELKNPFTTIPLHGPIIDVEEILIKLSKSDPSSIIHIDIAPSMNNSVASFLFSILILGHLSDKNRKAWRRKISQIYYIEVTFPPISSKASTALHQLLLLFPSAHCFPPSVKYAEDTKKGCEFRVGMDMKKLESASFQRVYYYLKALGDNKNLDRCSYAHDCPQIMDDPIKFLKVLGSHTSAKSWAELTRFIEFLNTQLAASETSSFLNLPFCDKMDQDVINQWSGMKEFILKLLLIMSKEFSSSCLMGSQGTFDDITRYDISTSHTWKAMFHPYLFFNGDHATITFMGFCITKKGDAIDPVSQKLILKGVMPGNLLTSLKHQPEINFSDNYQKWTKKKLLRDLGMIIGLNTDEVKDPDESYVITHDNVMKMMAILMRFRCKIPVIIMGETGCGKTRLLKYLCDLAAQKQVEIEAENMVILKVHSGTKLSDIVKAVNKAELIATKEDCSAATKKSHSQDFGVLLFFDEANTTEHVNVIKEIMCDHKLFGRKLHENVRIAAACNPYKRHSEKMIHKIQTAGLGLAKLNAQEMIGNVPLRELVYRVHELPPSMMSLVFDFGTLDKGTEEAYIMKIVSNQVSSMVSLGGRDNYIDRITAILSWSQEFMRERKNECSFVSLRDIERAMIVFKFFWEKMDIFIHLINKNRKLQKMKLIESKITKAMILTLSVCYTSKLHQRKDYETAVLKLLSDPFSIGKVDNKNTFSNELRCCQDVLLDAMKVGKNIAKNNALRENVFMMFVCISLRIPLFLIGKPGSSKSLAISIVKNSMCGPTSSSDLLKSFMEVQMFSYQCSQHSTSESIIKVFDKASKVQNESRASSRTISVVVLDEVGLAEFSPHLPLKVLHPLLEDGTEGNSFSIDVIEREKRVAFIGISNWALDPAKMNRGIMVTRCDPSKEELELSAMQICSEDNNETVKAFKFLKSYFSPFAEAYLELLEKQQKPYFGLRDFYSLVKMLYWMCKTNMAEPNLIQIEHVVRRNFGGFDEFDVFEIFKKRLKTTLRPCEHTSRELWKTRLQMEFISASDVRNHFFKLYKEEHRDVEAFTKQAEEKCVVQFKKCCRIGKFKSRQLNEQFEEEFLKFFRSKFDDELWPFVINPPCTNSGLIKASLANRNRTFHGESRYLLFITENYAALQTLHHFLEDREGKPSGAPCVLFGSSFRKDNTYTQICHKINTIKVCMATGRPVILLNLNQLYESLYDALNQHYLHIGALHYVDIGLHNHRFKCIVHDEFKLILIAEKTKVYNEFPTPLINRLEKHFVVTETILTEEEIKVKENFGSWINKFIPIDRDGFSAADSFIGFQEDTPAAVVLKASNAMRGASHEILEECKRLLLQIATPDALVRLNNYEPFSQIEYNGINKIYTEQYHSSLKDFLRYQFEMNSSNFPSGCRIQTTTFNNLLSEDEIEEIGRYLKLQVTSCLLQQFDTELEFTRIVRESFESTKDTASLLIVQCDSGHVDNDLIACGKHSVDYIKNQMMSTDSQDKPVLKCHVLFTVIIPREHRRSPFVGFLGGEWICAHIDTFCPMYNISPLYLATSNTPLSALFFEDTMNDSNAVNYCTNLHKLVQRAIQNVNTDFKSETAKRAQTINRILLSLLSEQYLNGKPFKDVLIEHIWYYIKEREACEKDWILRSALNQGKLQESGAFLQVLFHKLEEVIVDCFSAIVAFADQACNLSLLDPQVKMNSKLCDFWINSFHSTTVCSFHYNENGPIKTSKVEACMSTYSCKFPFFWVFKKKIDDVYRHIIEDLSPDKINNETFSLLQKHEIGEFLNSHCEGLESYYLYDFVRFTWKCVVSDTFIANAETEIIIKTIKKESDSMLKSVGFSPPCNPTDTILTFHLVAHMKNSEVLRFKHLATILPEILVKIDSQPMPIDAVAAVLSMSEIDHEIEPRYQILLDRLHCYHEMRNTIQAILHSYEDNGIVQRRSKWMGIQAVYLFIEHIVLKHTAEFTKTVQFANRLRIFVSHSSDFTKEKTVGEIEKILAQMYNEFEAHKGTDVRTFKDSCRSFYIDVIFKLSTGNAPPEEELILKLLKAAFNMDSEPVSFLRSVTDHSLLTVQSLILQQLLQSSYDNTRKQISQLFKEANSDLSSSELVQMQLLYCRLFESYLFGRDKSQSTGSREMFRELFLYINKSSFITLSHLQTNQITIEVLESIAYLHYALHFYTMNVYGIMNREHCNSELECFHTSIAVLCSQKDIVKSSNGPHVFLLKLLFKEYGESRSFELLSDARLQWLWPEGIQTNEAHESNLYDYFVVHGNIYSTCARRIVVSVKESPDALKSVALNPDEIEFPVLLGLSMFMEITLTFSKQHLDSKRIKKTEVDGIIEVIREHKHFSSEMKHFYISLLKNEFHGQLHNLVIMPQQALVDKIYCSIIVHIAAGLMGRKDNHLLRPFFLMLTDPLKLDYLPAMPEDILQSGRRILGGRVYKCANGHPYIVTECGLPLERTNCPVCRMEKDKSVKIGGKDRILTKGNKSLERDPQKGYTLGKPMKSLGVPERKLSRASTCIIKVLMHASLLWTCCTQQVLVSDILKIMKSEDINDPGKLSKFFWEHLVNDMNTLQKILLISFDDAALLIHLIMTRVIISKAETLDPTLNPSISSLETVAQREEWEMLFDRTHIQPVLTKLHLELEKAHKMILDNEHQKHPLLLDVVYERNISNPTFEDNLWKIHPQINLETLHLKLQGADGEHHVLSYFLKKEISLRATKYLPKIHNLLQYLQDKFHHRISDIELQETSIHSFLQDINNEKKREDIQKHIKALHNAWELVQGHLAIGQNYAEIDFSKTDTSLAFLIPSVTGEGSCTKLLVDHLVNVHNGFIELSSRILKQLVIQGQSLKPILKVHSVQLKDLDDFHLVQYEYQLTSVILAHSHYSLIAGLDQNQMHFDFGAIEKQLIDNFVYGKPVIHGDVPLVALRKDVYTAEKFESIRENIPQLPLSDASRRNILSNLSRIQQLKKALDQIEIIMGFLAASGKENSQMSLWVYATKVLKIQDFNEAIVTGFKLANVLALWDIVSVELAVKFTLTGMSFYKVQECFKLQLPEEMKKQLKEDLKHTPLETALSILNEFIETHVRNATDEQKDWSIIECIDWKLNNELKEKMKFLKQIPLKMVIDVWESVVKYQKKIEEQSGNSTHN